MSQNKPIKIEKDSTSNDDRNLYDSATIKIKEEIETKDDYEYRSVDMDIKDEITIEEPIFEERSEATDHLVNAIEIKQENDDLNIGANTDGLKSQTDEIQVKDEITFEETKLEEYSEHRTNKWNFSCKFCKFCSNSRQSLWRHIRNFHPEHSNIGCHSSDKHLSSGIECNICLTSYGKGQSNEHKDQCLGRLLLNCVTCDMSYVTKEGLMKHLDDHGEDIKVSSICETRVKEQFMCCVICEDDRAFRKDSYWKHVKDQHNGHYLVCQYCKKTFSRPDSRMKHLKQYCRLGPDRITFAPERVQCPECSTFCKNKAVLRYHKMKAHTEASFSCSYCAMKFHEKKVFHKHMDSHEKRGNSNNDEQKKFQCQTCLKRFRRRFSLNRHLTTFDHRT